MTGTLLFHCGEIQLWFVEKVQTSPSSKKHESLSLCLELIVSLTPAGRKRTPSSRPSKASSHNVVGLLLYEASHACVCARWGTPGRERRVEAAGPLEPGTAHTLGYTVMLQKGPEVKPEIIPL